MGTTHRGVARWEIMLLAASAILALLAVLPTAEPVVYDETRAQRPPESHCKYALHSIGIALHNFHDVHGAFPAATSRTNASEPLQSWRLLILPELDKRTLYDRFHVDEPWDGPHNLSLQPDLPAWTEFHRCPGNHDPSAPFGRTHFLAVVGPNTAWRTDRPVSINEVTDGYDRTILLVEVANSNVNWFEPRDLEWDKLSFKLNDPGSLSPGSRHVEPETWLRDADPYVNVLLVDGAVKKLPVDTPPEVLKALLTIDGGESFDPPWLK
jgi:hypothetical protein